MVRYISNCSAGISKYSNQTDYSLSCALLVSIPNVLKVNVLRDSGVKKSCMVLEATTNAQSMDCVIG